MTLCRLAVIILGLGAIAAGSVHLRWSNAHYAFLIQKQYDKYTHLKHIAYPQKRLELWRQQSPQTLLEQLEKWNFELQGWAAPETQPSSRKPTPTPAPRAPAVLSED